MRAVLGMMALALASTASGKSVVTATRNAAQALGRDKDVGAIAVGRFGDMVAVRGDPTTNVRLLEAVDAVIKGGTLVPRAVPPTVR